MDKFAHPQEKEREGSAFGVQRGPSRAVRPANKWRTETLLLHDFWRSFSSIHFSEHNMATATTTTQLSRAASRQRPTHTGICSNIDDTDFKANHSMHFSVAKCGLKHSFPTRNVLFPVLCIETPPYRTSKMLNLRQRGYSSAFNLQNLKFLQPSADMMEVKSRKPMIPN